MIFRESCLWGFVKQSVFTISLKMNFYREMGLTLFLFIELSTKKIKLGYVYDADRNEVI